MAGLGHLERVPGAIFSLCWTENIPITSAGGRWSNTWGLRHSEETQAGRDGTRGGRRGVCSQCLCLYGRYAGAQTVKLSKEPEAEGERMYVETRRAVRKII